MIKCVSSYVLGKMEEESTLSSLKSQKAACEQEIKRYQSYVRSAKSEVELSGANAGLVSLQRTLADINVKIAKIEEKRELENRAKESALI